MYSFKPMLETILKWIVRFALLPVLLYTAYTILYQNLTKRDFVEVLLLSGVLLLAILSPHPPWKNKALLYLCIYIIAVLVIGAWWLATIWFCVYVTKSIFGKEIADTALFSFLSVISCLAAQYFLAYFLSTLIQKNKTIMTLYQRIRDFLPSFHKPSV